MNLRPPLLEKEFVWASLEIQKNLCLLASALEVAWVGLGLQELKALLVGDAEGWREGSKIAGARSRPKQS